MTTQTQSHPIGAAALPTAPKVPEATFRMFRDASDYEGLAAVAIAANAADGIPWAPTTGQIRIEMEESSAINPLLDVMIVDLRGRAIAWTSVERVVRDGVPVYDMWAAVSPDHRRQGLGTRLLAWTIERIRERAAIEDPGVNVLVEGGAEEQETGHLALLTGAGFEPVRHFFLMRRPSLNNVPDAPLPEGLEVRPVAPDQLRPIIAAEFEAFRDHWGSRDLTEGAIQTTLKMAELDPSLWVVAWDGDQIAGVVENWIWTEENAKLGVKRGWLERISVRRPWRRRGLARALTAASLIRLREAGMNEGMLGVDSENANGALGLYEGLGFEIHSRSAAYRRALETTEL